MRKFAFLWVVFVILALQLGPLTDAQADVVGRLTQVEGRVDLLKGGQLPATPVKVDDGVQPGDVLRTKSLSKAQITFIDNSTLTIAPESRVAIEAYMFDPARISAMRCSNSSRAWPTWWSARSSSRPSRISSSRPIPPSWGCGAPSSAFASSPTVRTF